MRNLIWAVVALIVTRPSITDWIIRRAQKTPYSHITGPDGSTYMRRWWLFNPYGKDDQGEPTPVRWQWLPSIRVHHILRPDNDRHLHDHPWNARTIVLRGWYTEERPFSALTDREALAADGVGLNDPTRAIFHRVIGYTGRLLFGQYHRISAVKPGGVWTLFFTWPKKGAWGFDVDGTKVPWREYLNNHPTQPR